MSEKKYPVLLLLLCFLLPVSGFSQYFYFYANPFAFGTQVTRYTSGTNFVFVNAEYSGVVSKVNAGGGAMGDTMVTRNLKSTDGLGSAIGITLPIARTGRRNSLDLSIELHGNNYTFSNIDQGYSASGDLVAANNYYNGTTTTS